MSLRGKPSKVVRPVFMLTPCCKTPVSCQLGLALCWTYRIEDLPQRFELCLNPIPLCDELLQRKLRLWHSIRVASGCWSRRDSRRVNVVHRARCGYCYCRMSKLTLLKDDGRGGGARRRAEANAGFASSSWLRCHCHHCTPHHRGDDLNKKQAVQQGPSLCARFWVKRFSPLIALPSFWAM